MNPEISKSARDLLAKQPTPEAHPSADLLNGYVEQSLSAAEKTRVLTHLSSCAECREVVLLASGAAEEEMHPEILTAQAKADPFLGRVPVQVPAMPVGTVETVKPTPTPTRNWWKWAAPLAAIVIVGSTALIERDRIAEMIRPPSTQMAKVSGRAPAAPAAPATKIPQTVSPQKQANEIAADRAAREYTLQAPAANDAKTDYDAGNAHNAKKKSQPVEQARADSQKDAVRRKMLEAELASNLVAARPNPSAAAETKPATPPPAASSTTVEVTSAAPLVQADNADLSTAATDALKAESLAKSSLVANNQAVGSVAAGPLARQKGAANPHWRIGRDGELERSTGAGTWTQKLASEEVTFRAVATVGSNVWAGGNGGALFHSIDGGEHWNKVVLTANGQAEHGAIISIHFDTGQQGSVTSESGGTWTTTDGGQSWSKQ
jgi:hypothetical protein